MFRKFIVLALLSEFLTAQALPAASLSETRSNFEWFSRLGFPDVKGCSFVRIATGGWSQTTGEQPQNTYIDGFLLASNGNAFSVFTPSLFKHTFTNSAPGTATYKRVGFELEDLRQYAQTTLASLRTAPQNDHEWWDFRYDTRLAERARAFVLAWACWRQGFETEAQQLYDQAKTMPPQHRIDHTDSEFRIALEKDFADASVWQALNNFGNPSITRPELLRQFELILTNYPHSEYCERAPQAAMVLKRMIAEDQHHAEVPRRNLDELPAEEKVHELIFHLRDQNGHQTSEPGSCDILEDWRSTNTPAHELVRMGFTAVPQLIQALDSDAFSRSVNSMSDDVYFDAVLTVGDCAEQILEKITCKSFSRAGWMAGRMSKNEKAAGIRRAAEDWWAEVQKKGEKQMLIDAIASPGDYDARAEAALLRQRYRPPRPTHGLSTSALKNENDSSVILKNRHLLDISRG